MRIGRIEKHFQIECETDFTIHFRFGALMKAAALAAVYRDVLRVDIMIGNDCFTGFGHVGDFPIKTVSDKRERLLQSGVPRLALVKQALVFSRRQAAPDFFL